MKKVVQNYINLLPFLGLSADEEGKIFSGSSELGELKELIVDDKPVYLPTQEFLKSADKSKVGFHPLAESVVMKPSPILKAIQDSLNQRLNVIAVVFMQTIIHAAISQKKNTLKSKDPNLMNILVGNEDCTADTKAFLDAILEAVITSKDSFKVIRVYFKSGGEIRDEKYSRICSISSPLLEQLERPGVKEVFGVTPKRKKDIAVLTHVLKTVFPGLDTKAYTRGSNDGVVPYMDSILQSLRVLTEDINTVARDLKDVEPAASVLEYLTAIPSDLDEFDDYEMLRNQIPPLPYNDGSGFLTETDNRRVDLVEREDNAAPVSRTPYSIYDKPQVAQQPTPVQPLTPVAATPQTLARTPGTRQHLVQADASSDVVRNDFAPRDRNRNAGYGGGRREDDRDDYEERRRGYSSPSRGHSRSNSRIPDRPRIDDYHNLREVEDDIELVRREIRNLEDDRRYRDADDLRNGTLRDLYDIEDRMKRESRDRDYNDRNRNDRNRSYSSRPSPRGARNNGRNDRNSGYRERRERDRFGR